MGTLTSAPQDGPRGPLRTWDSPSSVLSCLYSCPEQALQDQSCPWGMQRARVEAGCPASAGFCLFGCPTDTDPFPLPRLWESSYPVLTYRLHSLCPSQVQSTVFWKLCPP